MNITEIKRSPYSNFTKSKMFSDYYDSLDDSEDNTEVYHYYRCYEALAIIEILNRECQRIDEKAAKNMGLFRHSYFTAWIGKDLIFQWDDTNADEFLKDPEKFPCCIDKRFERWWVYPKQLIKQQNVSYPPSMEELLNLKPSPIRFSASVLLNCIVISLDFTSKIVQLTIERSEINNN